MERQGQDFPVITGSGSISALGISSGPENSTYLYSNYTPGFSIKEDVAVAAIPGSSEARLQELMGSDSAFRSLDRSVHLALYAVAEATRDREMAEDIIIHAGSSRGAAGLLEHHYNSYREGRLSATSSPTTTAGNVSSWIGYRLRRSGGAFSHSVTCSSGLQSIANGIAWIKAGMCRQFLAVGTEAPLTPFTIAQMKALGIYSKALNNWPARPFASDYNGHGMILGEGAAAFILEPDNGQPNLARIKGLGLASELIPSKSGISEQGDALYKAMQMAVKGSGITRPDAIIAHAPGTPLGDKAEYNAIQRLFGDDMPTVLSNKHLAGHSLGASSVLSVEYGIALLHGLEPPGFPYSTYLPESGDTPPSLKLRRARSVLVNSTGFGGNAYSLLLAL